MYVNVDKDTLVESNFLNCNYILMEVIPRNLGNGWTMVMQGKGAQLMFCVYLATIRVTACYIDAITDIKSASRYAALGLSRIQFGPELAPYNVHRDEEILKHCFYVHKNIVDSRNYMFSTYFEEDKLTLRNIPSYIKYCKRFYPKLLDTLIGHHELPVLKVSAQHLRHISIHELRKVNLITILRRCAPMLELLEHMINIGIHEAMISGLIVWGLVLQGDDRTLMNYCGVWNWKFKDALDFADQIKKQFSLRLKAIQNTIEYDLTNFFEFEVLTNRGIGEVDWNTEKEHRVQPNLTNFENVEIYSSAKELFSNIKNKGKTPPRQKWKRFWDQRWKWAPTGTYHSQYEKDDQYRATERTLRHKLFTLCAMPTVKYDYFSNRKPECKAWPSTKFEWGKQRAIYGVDLTNFVMSSYGMLGAEELLSDEFPIGPSATAENVSLKVKTILQSGIPFCFDFEDFNSQHSNGHMASVLYAYIDVFRDNLTDEQVYAIQWTAAAINQTYVKHVDDSWYKTNGTLMSGWRLTTFMNTVLNKIYVTLCDKQNTMVTVHNGDDVLAAVGDLRSLQNFMKNCKRRNIRFQATKCYLASIAEFLRIDHKANKGKGSQYLSRGVATFVHGPTETVLPNDLRAVIQANYTRASELLERGANKDVVNMLLLILGKHICKLWNITDQDYKAVLDTHQVFGGVSTNITLSSDNHVIDMQMVEQAKTTESLDDMNRFFPGALDYAKHVCNTVIDKSMFSRVYTAVKKSIIHNSITRRFTLRVNKQRSDAISNLKMLRNGTLRKMFTVAKAELAMAYNVPLYLVGIEAQQLEQMLSYETDKLAALKILL